MDFEWELQSSDGDLVCILGSMIYIYIHIYNYIGAVILLDRIALEYPQVASQGLIKIPLVSETGWETMIMMTSSRYTLINI